MALLFACHLLVIVFSLLTSATANLRVIRLPMGKVDHSTDHFRNPSAYNHFTVTLENPIYPGLYYVNATIGTPDQNIALQIDTGSSDVWMFGPNSCNPSTSLCLGGTFQPRHSTTINHVEPGFAIRYVTPGSAVQGSYFNDDFGIVGLEPLKLHNITMAIAEQAAGVQIGIMGIGLDTNEARSNNGTTYLNFIDQMVKQDKINSRSYSLWLDGLHASTGTILFGGYDRAKYHGNLTHLKIQADIESGTFNTMTVAWTSLSVTNPNGINYLTPLNFSSLAILDAGTTFTGVPTTLFAQLAAYFDVVQNETYGYLVRCNVSDYLGSIDFGFGGSAEPTISINYSEFVIPPYNSTNNPVMFPDGSEACLFGMFPIADGEQILFGDTFLRSAYVVYNLDELEISIAPTNFGSTSSDIIEISKMT